MPMIHRVTYRRGVIHLNKTGICIVCGCIFILFLYVFSRNDYSSTGKTTVNLKEVLKLAISAAESGGIQVVLTNVGKIETKGKTKEGANESVTSADFNSHCVMLDTLNHSLSNVKIISEEKINCQKSSSQQDKQYINKYLDLKYIDELKDSFVNPIDITVWIDPLDATQEYTEKLNQYVTTMVCVAVKGEPVIGVIHKPFLKQTYWGWVGNGQSSNLKNKLPEKGTKAKFIISRSHSGKIHELIQKKFTDFSIIEAGGSGYKVLELTNGNADVYIHNTAIKKWDICAGNAILNTLGGKMTALSGDNIFYGAEQNTIHADGLLAALRDYDFYIKKL